MKQNHEIRFKCTKEELDKIKERSTKVNMSIKNYLLFLGLKTEVEIIANGKKVD